MAGCNSNAQGKRCICRNTQHCHTEQSRHGIQVQMLDQGAEGMALSWHCLYMEPVVTTFPPLNVLFGSYGQAHRTSRLQDHMWMSRRAHHTARHMLGSLRLLAHKTKSHRNMSSPQQMVGESKSHAHSHIKFPPTAKTSLM